MVPTAPLPDDAGTWTNDGPYAVLHLCGKYSDKDVSQMVWHRLAQHLTNKGLRLAFTGGGGEVEGKRIADVARFLPRLLSKVLGRSFVRTDGGTASTRGALCRRRHVDDPRRGRSGSARSCSLRTYFGLSLGAGALRGFAQLRKPRESAALKDRDVQKNPDYADCRQYRPRHKTRCPRSSDTSLAMCLQTMPPDIVVAEVDRILAGRADASLPVSARTPDLSTKPD